MYCPVTLLVCFLLLPRLPLSGIVSGRIGTEWALLVASVPVGLSGASAKFPALFGARPALGKDADRALRGREKT